MIQENVKPVVGSILLSEPFMLDPHFKRTVILLCEHDEQNGSVGFILNKTVNNVKVADALVDFEMVKTPLFYGGPVAHDTLHYLHSYGEIISDSILITEGIYWGGDFEQITDYLKNGTIQPEGIRFFMGYSGWDPGQLMDELKDNSWIISQGKSEYLYKTAHEALWKKALEDLGGKFSMMKNYPENPMLN